MASSARRRRRCRFCRDLFLPDPRLKSGQIACSKAECQKARKRANQDDWLQRHPGYFKGRYPNTKTWLEEHPGYQRQYRGRRPEAACKDNLLRKKRHEIAQKARADIQDSISLQEAVSKRLTPDLFPGAPADIQDSIWPQVVMVSIFSASFGSWLQRRYTRLDGRGQPAQVPSRA